MNENIVGVLIGGGIGLLSTLITLIVTGYNDRTRRRLKYKERQVGRIALNEGAKPTLKTYYRNQAGDEGATSRMVPRNEVLKALELSKDMTNPAMLLQRVSFTCSIISICLIQKAGLQFDYV